MELYCIMHNSVRMCKDLAVDNQTTINIDNMNNINVAPQTQQMELSVRGWIQRLGSMKGTVQERVVEMYNMLVGISGEIERIKLELVQSE